MLAIEVWSDRLFLAIDTNNHEYDFNITHKSAAVFPVFVLGKHGKREMVGNSLDGVRRLS